MRRLLPLLLLLIAVGAGALWWTAEAGRRAAWQRVAELEAKLKEEAGAPRPDAAKPSEPPAEQRQAPPDARIVRVPSGADSSAYLKTIDELRQYTAQLTRDLSEAREAASRADVQRAAVAAELEKAQNQHTGLRDDLESARRAIGALQGELRSKGEMLVRAETAERLGQEKLARAEASVTRVSGASRELEEINRRRETTLNNLLRRYREVTDLYRNFTLSAQNRENQTAGMQAGDLSRIQSSIQQAEDDLRQLNTLNARAAQLARAK